MLVHKGKLQVAYKSATCNLSLWFKARTEHAQLSPFRIYSIAVRLSVLLLTATPHTLAKRHKICRHSDILMLMATGLLLA